MMPTVRLKHLRDLDTLRCEKSRQRKKLSARSWISRSESHGRSLSGEAKAYSRSEKNSHTGRFGCQSVIGEMFWSEETFAFLDTTVTAKTAVEAILKRVHPDDQKLWSRANQSCNERVQGKDCKSGYRLLLARRFGSSMFTSWLTQLKEDKAGNIEFVGTVTDITKRKTTEEDLRSSEGTWRKAQRMSQTGSWDWSAANGGPFNWRRSVIVFWVFSIQPMDLHHGEDFFSEINS